MKLIIFSLCLISVFTTGCVRAQTQARAVAYKCVDSKGQVSLQTSPCEKTSTQSELSSDGDFSGPLETWARLGEALKRGDKAAALNEFTFNARSKYSRVFDAVLKDNNSFDIAKLGIVRGMSLSDEIAFLKLERKGSNGAVSTFEVQLIRDHDLFGTRWFIDEM